MSHVDNHIDPTTTLLQDTPLEHRPTACEGIDSRIVDVVRERKGAAAVPALPSGAAWVFVEMIGDTLQEAITAQYDSKPLVVLWIH